MKISAQIFSMVLATLLLVNTMRVSFTYAYYEIDPIGFIEALCENKDRPELQCNGKCHLKKVSKSQDNNQKTPESIVDFKELLLYPNPETKFTFIQKSYTSKRFPIAYQNLYSFIETNDCFHPPRV
jgi:hypothetical protein